MRILILNHRYFPSGGPEEYLFKVTSLLENKGHEVIPFSFQNPNNLFTPFQQYFAPSPYPNGATYFKDSGARFLSKITGLKRLFYFSELGESLERIVKDYKPDLAYFIQTVNFLYPTAVQVLKKNRVPIVVRFSDFQFVCPAYTLFRDEKICEDCKDGIWHGFTNKCLQDSYFVSGGRVLAMLAARFRGLDDKIDAWVIPSEFTLKKISEFGFNKKNTFHIPTFHFPRPEPKIPKGIDKESEYFLYMGNLQSYKGAFFLCDCFSKGSIPISLKLAGFGQNEDIEKIKQISANAPKQKIEFLGTIPNTEVPHWIKKAKAVIIPSLCYENLPNVMIEAMSLGTPVIASKLGSLKEFIVHGETGLLFEPGNESDLIGKLNWALDHPKEMAEIGLRGKEFAEERFSPERHYDELIKVFKMITHPVL